MRGGFGAFLARLSPGSGLQLCDGGTSFGRQSVSLEPAPGRLGARHLDQPELERRNEVECSEILFTLETKPVLQLLAAVLTVENYQ